MNGSAPVETHPASRAEAYLDREGDPANSTQFMSCVIENISLGGAAITLADGASGLVGPACLAILSAADRGTLLLPFTVVQRRGNLVTVQFRPDPWIRHALIRKLFTGLYHHDVEQISAWSVLSTLSHNLIS